MITKEQTAIIAVISASVMLMLAGYVVLVIAWRRSEPGHQEDRLAEFAHEFVKEISHRDKHGVITRPIRSERDAYVVSIPNLMGVATVSAERSKTDPAQIRLYGNSNAFIEGGIDMFHPRPIGIVYGNSVACCIQFYGNTSAVEESPRVIDMVESPLVFENDRWRELGKGLGRSD